MLSIFCLYEYYNKGKGQPITSQEDLGWEGGLRYSCNHLISAIDGSDCKCPPPPAALAPRERNPVPIVYEAGWAPGLLWTGAEKSRPLLRFEPRNVQPVASHTDYAMPAHLTQNV